jgi:2-oxoglutarate dehydrogenase E2 component (dihydrolipoamide succinyltransferase)
MAAPVTPAVAVAPAAPAVAVAPAAIPAGASDAGYVTPLVRKLANESGVDLTAVAGTGVGGRIRKDDVLAAVGGSSAPAAAATAAPVAVQASALRGTTEPMSRLRKVLAERAVASMVSTAQLTTVVEVDVTKIAQLRARVQSNFVAKNGVKLNFMPFFALAAAEALKAHPKLNASIEGDNIVYHPTENIAFAVDTERGLLTPVIRDASTLNLSQIALQIADMAARTRNNQLKPDELGGGTFTLTNTGSRGALFDTPVVFLPQVAILGTGVVAKRPAVVTDADGNESIAIRSMVYLALSYDHRLVDGADASRYLVDVKTRLEDANFGANLGL